MPSAHTVDQHFTGKPPEVRRLYDRLLRAVSKLGPCEEDPKKTSIHLNRRTAFAGVATRKAGIVLTVKSGRKPLGRRVLKSEQASAQRWHFEVRINTPSDIDAELIGWLKEAYELSA